MLRRCFRHTDTKTALILKTRAGKASLLGKLTSDYLPWLYRCGIVALALGRPGTDRQPVENFIRAAVRIR
jgi:hypothetical protein